MTLEELFILEIINFTDSLKRKYQERSNDPSYEFIIQLLDTGRKVLYAASIEEIGAAMEREPNMTVNHIGAGTIIEDEDTPFKVTWNDDRNY